jgi:hypothetical protein
MPFNCWALIHDHCHARIDNSLRGGFVNYIELKPNGPCTSSDGLVSKFTGSIGAHKNINDIWDANSGYCVGNGRVTLLAVHDFGPWVDRNYSFTVFLKYRCHPVGGAVRVIAEPHNKPELAFKQ